MFSPAFFYRQTNEWLSNAQTTSATTVITENINQPFSSLGLPTDLINMSVDLVKKTYTPRNDCYMGFNHLLV